MTVSAIDHSLHTPFSDPGRYADLVSGLPTDPASLSSVARNLIVHYRASGHTLPVATRDDINARWLERTLELDQGRHATSPDVPRPVVDRVQGCCRDHTLFCVGVLRSQGVPARSRVGFAGYLTNGWHYDHVVVEAWLRGRWQRFDPETEEGSSSLTTPTDIGFCEVDSNGFVTAAQVWSSARRDEVDPETYGVDPAIPVLRGQRFLLNEVIYEVARRFGDELLLWDIWGRMGLPEEPVSDQDAQWIDGVADLLVRSDEGDQGAERELFEQYRTDAGLHPSSVVIQASPYGDRSVEVRLDQR